MEQGLGLEKLIHGSADAEDRRMSSHDELIGMMAAILKTSRERESPGGGLAARRDAASPSSEFSHGDSGGRDGGRVPAEAEHRGVQLGRRGQDRGLGPIGESSISHTVAWMVGSFRDSQKRRYLS